METIEIKKTLLEEAIDQLKKAQQDCFVPYTQNVINELEIVLNDPRFVVLQESLRCGIPNDYKIPENKQKEFCDWVSFSAWESKFRGYNYLNSEIILSKIKSIN